MGCFELTNPGWNELPEYADNGPVGYLIEYCEACGYPADGFEEAENTYRELLEGAQQQGSRAFLKHKARNGQTWEQYLAPAKLQVTRPVSLLVHGASASRPLASLSTR